MAKKRTYTKTKSADGSKSKTVTRQTRRGTVTKTKTKKKVGSITNKSKSKTESTRGGKVVTTTSKSVQRRKNPGQEAKKTVTRTGSRNLQGMAGIYSPSQRAMKKTERFARGQSLKKRVTRSGSATDSAGMTMDDMGGGLTYNRFGDTKKTIKGRSVTQKRRRR